MPCLDCPYNECNIVGGTSERQISGTCQGWLMKDALALIKEITDSEDYWKRQAFDACMDKERMDNKIKELTEENEKLTINMNAYGLTAKRLGEELQKSY